MKDACGILLILVHTEGSSAVSAVSGAEKVYSRGGCRQRQSLRTMDVETALPSMLADDTIDHRDFGILCAMGLAIVTNDDCMVDW